MAQPEFFANHPATVLESEILSTTNKKTLTTMFSGRHDLQLRQLLAGVALACLIPSLPAAEIPGDKQNQPVALIGGTVHRIDGPAEVANLVFDNGKILTIGGVIPDDAQQIDVKGHHVYPGLIDADSTMGLVEINAVRATRDDSEVGLLNPNARAAVAFNPDSEIIPVTRANGLLFANVVPRGSFVTGQSSLIMLDGWNIEDMTVKADTGLHITWPRIEPGKRTNERIDEVAKLLKQARAYHELRKAEHTARFDPRLESLGPLLRRESKLFVHANSLLSIQSAVAFAEQHRADLVIVGGYDAPRAARLLKRHKVRVIITGTHRLPRHRHAPYDEPFTVPRRLHEAGVRFCISSGGRFGASNARNLPHHAATAAAFGLPAEVALRSITLSAAQILGAAGQIGSLTSGKDATLFVADGDILEVATQVTHAFVQGRDVSLENRHTRLYKKFRTKHLRNPR